MILPQTVASSSAKEWERERPKVCNSYILARFQSLCKMFRINIILQKRECLMWIFRTWTTTRDGRRIYAKDYGKRAFRIWIGPGRRD